MMRVGNHRWRTLKDRHNEIAKLESILSVPHLESWLLALAFHKPKEYILNGILNGTGNRHGLIEKIMCNQKIV